METLGQYGKSRFWEMVPGALAWGTFILAILTSFFAPMVAVAFIIIFDIYWTLRVLYFIVFVFASHRNYKRAIGIDWQERIKEIKGWDNIYHLIFLPTYQEDLSILRAALDSLKHTRYRKDRLIVVFGGEEGDIENFSRYQKILKQEFGGIFKDLLFTVHPRGIKGEIPGKGSNMKWMGEQMQKKFASMDITDENIIVSAFDVDTIAHEQYFGRLTYVFLTTENPLQTSYQPLNLFSNNIWHASPVVRITSFGTVFWLLSELVRPERMWTFSSHSMPWKMLLDVGFWESDMVSEDSRIFLQGFLHYGGDYKVEPLFMPVHMDAVEGDGFIDSLKALYKQQRRWAWGVEHLPYMMRKFKGRKDIPFYKKAKMIFNQLEGMYTWATAPLLIFVLGYLPFFVAGDSATAFMANSPFTLERIMQVATVGVFVSGIMSFFFLPKRPEGIKRRNWIVMVLQWIMLPITFVIFSAFPAIDAQTRMMLGKYLGFNVTKKKR
ncbi:glycosyltransferase family 2 protein [Patescibacteria group bacterium]|nr:glycosyltransferase family 2 protein [Patescibacteria group bacterium]